MKLVKPSIEFIAGKASVELIELAARTCYKSEDKIIIDSAQKIYNSLIKRGHEAMTEFGWIFYKVICDRGVTHEIVRHRLFSFAQESTRYCNYREGCTFVIPPWISEELANKIKNIRICFSDGSRTNEEFWIESLNVAAGSYRKMLEQGWSPQQARSVLPNSLKTEINIAGNVREWRHFFKLRCAKSAHPQMREIAWMILEDALIRFPGIFDDIAEVESKEQKKVKE
jgi:thymidylate synthase (FAD)